MSRNVAYWDLFRRLFDSPARAYDRMMDTSLALVRHGQTDWNLVGRLQGRTDIPLNDTGREQARQVGQRLAGQGWDLVLASPLGRAQETARLIAGETGATPGGPLPELIERAFGPLEGRIMAEVSDEESAAVSHELEPHEAILRRTLPALAGLAARHAGRKVLVVSHGATMRIVRDALAGFRAPQGVANGEVVQIDLPVLESLVEEIRSNA